MKMMSQKYKRAEKIGKGLLAFAILASATTTAFADKDKDKDETAFKKVEGELSVMVLGSGGPIATAEGRASAGYLIFTDGKPRILMDVGGGTYQRLAESGTNIKDLDIVLLSHLHADHTGDLTSVIKTIYFHNNLARSQGITTEGRTAPIRIWGPASTTVPRGSGKQGFYFTKPDGTDGPLVYPSTVDYVDGHYSIPKSGVERYLKAFVFGISDDNGPPFAPGENASNFAYTTTDLSSKIPFAEEEEVLRQVLNEGEPNEGELVIKAIAVDHGPVPAVAFRIEYKGHTIVYSGDTGTKGPYNFGMANMKTISANADLLIYDTAVMENTVDPTTRFPRNPLFHILHTQPSLIAEVAREADVDTVLLSHLTPVTSPRVDLVKDLIRDNGYTGDIEEAEDLEVYNLD